MIFVVRIVELNTARVLYTNCLIQVTLISYVSNNIRFTLKSEMKSIITEYEISLGIQGQAANDITESYNSP